jgi:protein SCO1
MPRLAPVLAALCALTVAACGHPAPSAPASHAVSAAESAASAAASDYSVYESATTWRDAAGATRPLSSLAGRPRVLAMVYTRCSHTCPAIIGELKHVEAQLPPGDRGRVGFVLVSLDPARDTPATLRAYGQKLRLDPARWTLLTGDATGVREVAALLGMRYRPEAGGEFSHANSYVVLDRAGRIVHRQDGVGSGTAPVLASLRREAR